MAKKTKREKAQEIAKVVLKEGGGAIAWANRQMPDWASYVNPLTVLEDSPEAQSVRQGLTLGWADEAIGALAGKDEGDKARRQANEFKERRPGASFVGEMAGSMALPGGAVAGASRRGLGALLASSRYAPAMAAAEGAAYGAGVGEGAKERATGAAIGAGTGYIAGRALRPLLGKKANERYQDAMQGLLENPNLKSDIFVDPASFEGRKLYHVTGPMAARRIQKEGLTPRAGSDGLGGKHRNFSFLAEASEVPFYRDYVRKKMEIDPSVVEIDPSKLDKGSVLIDRWNVPRKAKSATFYSSEDTLKASMMAEHPLKAHKAFQVQGDIPAEAVLRVLTPEEAAAKLRRLSRGEVQKGFVAPRKLHRAKHTPQTLGRGGEKIRTLSPDEAVESLRELSMRPKPKPKFTSEDAELLEKLMQP